MRWGDGEGEGRARRRRGRRRRKSEGEGEWDEDGDDLRMVKKREMYMEKKMGEKMVKKTENDQFN